MKISYRVSCKSNPLITIWSVTHRYQEIPCILGREFPVQTTWCRTRLRFLNLDRVLATSSVPFEKWGKRKTNKMGHLTRYRLFGLINHDSRWLVSKKEMHKNVDLCTVELVACQSPILYIHCPTLLKSLDLSIHNIYAEEVF